MTPYTLKHMDGQWIAHAIAFDLVASDEDQATAIEELKTVLAAQIAWGKAHGRTLRECYFAAPPEYWDAPEGYKFIPIPSDEELSRFHFTEVN